MTHKNGIWLVVAALVGSMSSAHANAKAESRQAAAPGTDATKDSKAPLDRFLEQRVAEELAADGTVLSRLGVSLEIEQVGDHLLVSLVDPSTRRAVASTKVDKVPADREAAVASVTQVVANLTTQLSTKPASGTNDVKEALEHDREERRAREEAEFHYKQEAITFGDLYVSTTSSNGSTSVSHSMLPYKGGRQLSPDEFYVEVGRQDLADRYNHRGTVGWTTIGIGSAIVLGGTVYLLAANPKDNCDVASSDFLACEDRQDADFTRHLEISLGIASGGLLMTFVGYYYLATRNSLSKNEIYDLAEGHNAKLRQKYNMPGATSSLRPHVRDLAFAPYATADGGGFAVAGRF